MLEAGLAIHYYYIEVNVRYIYIYIYIYNKRGVKPLAIPHVLGTNIVVHNRTWRPLHDDIS